MVKKLRVAVDHGNRNMKTSHFIFTSGLNVLDKKPARGETYLQYGRYFIQGKARRYEGYRSAIRDVPSNVNQKFFGEWAI